MQCLFSIRVDFVLVFIYVSPDFSQRVPNEQKNEGSLPKMLGSIIMGWICYTDRPDLQLPWKLTEIRTRVGPMKRLLDSEVKSIQRMAHFLTGCRLSQIMHNLGPSIARHLRRCNLTCIGGNSRSNIPTSHFRRMRLRLVAVGTRRTKLYAFSDVSRLPLEGIS